MSIQYISGQQPDFYTWLDKEIGQRQPPGGYSNFISTMFGFNSTTLKKRHGPGMEMAITQSTGVRGGDSWLLGKEHLKSADLAQVLEESMPKNMDNPQLRGQGIGGPGIFSQGNDTSVVPAWRRTYTHIIHLGSKDPVADPMRKLAPKMGAYVNEASRFTPGWRTAFWGNNYERLSSIKNKYDPDHLFWVTPGINADDWAVDGDRICRNTATLVDTKSAALDLPPKTDNVNVVDATARGIDEYPGPMFPWVPGGIWGVTLNPGYFS